jgi:cytochrome oxidase assembly protein ShyY1
VNYFRENWKHWSKWLAVVVVFAVGCGFLADWQFDRRAERVARINLVLENFDADTVPIAELLPELQTWSSELEWRAVELTGSYLSEKALLVRNRPNRGSPGFEQLLPFKTIDGRVLLVSRGWLPTGNEQDSPDANPLPSGEQRQIVVRLRPTEPVDSRSAPAQQVPNIDVPRVTELLGLEDTYQGTYGRLYSDSSEEVRLLQMESPSTDEGNNLSYALQWILFGLMAFAALFWMIRQERDRALGRVRTKVRKRASDEEIEDAAS